MSKNKIHYSDSEYIHCKSNAAFAFTLINAYVYVCTSICVYIHTQSGTLDLFADRPASVFYFLSKSLYTHRAPLIHSLTRIWMCIFFFCICVVTSIRQLDLNFNVSKPSKQWQRSERVLGGQSWIGRGKSGREAKINCWKYCCYGIE